MTRLAVFALLLLLAACGPQRAVSAPSGFTSGNGGADAYLHTAPTGTTNFPYMK